MKATPWQILKAYWESIRQHRWSAFGTWFCIAMGVVTAVLSPVLYKRFFDALAQPVADGLAATLLKIVFQVLALNIVGWVFWRGATFLHIYISSQVMTDLRQRSFDYLMKHSYGFFAGSFGGSLVQKVNRLARSFETFFDNANWNLLPLAVRITGIMAVIWLYNRPLALILLIWTAVFLGANYFLTNWKIKYDLAASERDSQTTGALADAITNHANIQLFASFQRESEKFRGVAGIQRRAMKLAWDLDGVIEAMQAVLMLAVEFAIFYFAIGYWKQGLISIGTFVLLQAYLIQLIGQLWEFSRTLRNIYRSVADSEEMVTILNTPHEIQDVPRAKKLVVKEGRIAFEAVRFSFHATRQVIKGIDLEIAPGEKVALIGPSGAGKSTVVKLLLRLYDLESGHILIDGQDIHSVTQASLWRNISLVPQDPILFHRSLLENIRYGKPDATRAEVEQAAKLAHCDDFIDLLPEKYDTFVGERGIKLSGGERQRVAIARAILKNSPILVLDEATSSLDSHSEALIQDALKALMQGKTAIVIAHRLSTIQAMDRIVVMDNGQIKEEGGHGELLAKAGSLYRHLWELQSGGFLKAEGQDRMTAIVKESSGQEEEM